MEPIRVRGATIHVNKLPQARAELRLDAEDFFSDISATMDTSEVVQLIGMLQDSISADAEHFDEFWAVCHLRTGKEAARKAFDRATKKVGAERNITPDEAARYIVDKMDQFAGSHAAKPTDHTPIHPSTWLNQGRYDDDISAWYRSGYANTGSASHQQAKTLDEYRKRKHNRNKQ